jgi:hAT family C-terminal dimerisation region
LTYVSELDKVLASTSRSHQDQDELTQYLEGGKSYNSLSNLPFYLILTLYFYLGLVNMTPTQFWKDHQHEFPTLARVARDIFSIPATGAGVERLFNSARDVCHYRRGRLNPTTIQDLMLYSYTTKFEIEEEQLQLAQSLEIPEEGEIEEICPQTEEINPISDTEEDEQDLRQSIRGGKRRKSVTSEDEVDQIDGSSEDEDDNGLPIMQSEIRESGRARKRPKGFENYEIRIN